MARCSGIEASTTAVSSGLIISITTTNSEPNMKLKATELAVPVRKLWMVSTSPRRAVTWPTGVR